MILQNWRFSLHRHTRYTEVFSYLMGTSYHFDYVSGGDGVALVVKGNGFCLAWLNGMLGNIDLFTILSQHFKHLLFQTDYHPHSLLTVCVCVCVCVIEEEEENVCCTHSN